MTDAEKNPLSTLPSVNDLLRHPQIAPWIDPFGREVVKTLIRETLDSIRLEFSRGNPSPSDTEIIAQISRAAHRLNDSTLRPMINGTGIVLHTNLSRAPLGSVVLEEIAKVAVAYSNLEYDTETTSRGSRHVHARDLLRHLTGAEDVIVVNNNAAAIVLALQTLAMNREVIVSRSELIEIGGSFRIPDIMNASGARMVEVGTTNRTRIEDYENAIGPNTALIFKAHKSNFSMQGFVEEVSIQDLCDLAHRHSLPMMYDLGSGLLRRPAGLPLENEPDVRSALKAGADIVSFSGDKLLGGPQAGIIVGKIDLIQRLSKAPLMRALRVCKLTYAALVAVCRQYGNDETLLANNPTFAMLSRSEPKLQAMAEELVMCLAQHGVLAKVVSSFGQCGGGTLPDLRIPSRAVEILPVPGIGNPRSTFAEILFAKLHEVKVPILGVLREGKFIVDVLTLSEEQISKVAEGISDVVHSGEVS